MNLTTFRVWCYACEKEVFLEQRPAAQLAGPSPRFSEQVRGVPWSQCRRVVTYACDPGVGGAGMVVPGWHLSPGSVLKCLQMLAEP